MWWHVHAEDETVCYGGANARHLLEIVANPLMHDGISFNVIECTDDPRHCEHRSPRATFVKQWVSA